MERRTGSVDDAVLSQIARAAQGIGGLPGAPTQDWGDRLARVLVAGAPASACTVVVRRWGGSAECTGFASGAAVCATAAESVEQNHLDRCRELRDGSASVGETETGLVGPDGNGVGSGPPVPAVWARVPVGHAGQRSLVTIWETTACGCDEEDLRDMQRVLASVLPLARDRLGLALRGTRGRVSWLSAREQCVLEHLTRGMSVPEIAARLGRSHHTVRDYVKSLHRKMGTTSRGSLIARALGRECAGDARGPLACPTPSRHSFVDRVGW